LLKYRFAQRIQRFDMQNTFLWYSLSCTFDALPFVRLYSALIVALQLPAAMPAEFNHFPAYWLCKFVINDCVFSLTPSAALVMFVIQCKRINTAEGSRHAQVILNHRRGAGPAVADRAIVALGHGAAHKLILIWRWIIGASFELNVYAMVAAPGGRDKYIGYAGVYALAYQSGSGAFVPKASVRYVMVERQGGVLRPHHPHPLGKGGLVLVLSAYYRLGRSPYGYPGPVGLL
jgi:hypothetical protein